jgi:hypothetical protein
MERAQAALWLATLKALDDGQCYFGDPQGKTPRGVIALTPSGVVYSDIARDFLLFDGVDDYVTIPQNAAYNSNNLTVELWFKAPSAAPAATKYLATKWDNVNDREFTLHLTTDGKLHFMVRKADNTADVDVASAATYLDGQWHHVAGVKAAGGGLTLYVDSVSAGTGALGQEGKQNAQIVRAGSNLSGASANAFAGPICELRIWNVARTQPQILANLAKQLIGSETNLVGYWRFDERPAPRSTTSPPPTTTARSAPRRRRRRGRGSPSRRCCSPACPRRPRRCSSRATGCRSVPG